MKLTKKIVSIVLCLAMCLGIVGILASCGEDPASSSSSKGDGKTITIKYYNGGYGDDWIAQIADAFKAANPEYKVTLTADANLLSSIGSELETGTDTDIYICHDIQWQYYASEGYLAQLDDLYEMTNSDGDKFSSRVKATSLDSAKYNGHYYKAHWTQGVGGIMYNVDMFEANGWAVPTTYDELVALCNTIVAANLPNNDSSGIVRPFSWSGTEEYMWDYTVFEWWAQLAGLNKIATLMQYESAETFNSANNWAEMKQAYTLWYNLIVEHPEYSVANVTSQNKTASQQQFILGNAAMIPSAQWLYKEAGGADAGFDIAVMNTPTAPGAVETGKLNYNVGFGDSIVIPKNSDALEGAKKFVLFMSNKASCKTFVEQTKGAFLAFDYSTVDLGTVATSNKFIESINAKLTQSTNFNHYSQNPITFFNYQKVMPWINNTYYYKNAFNDAAANTPDIVFGKVYQTATTNWSAWSRAAQ